MATLLHTCWLKALLQWLLLAVGLKPRWRRLIGGGPGADDEDDVADAVAASQEDLARVIVNQPSKLNSIALKWIRDSHEDPLGNPKSHAV